MPTPVPTPKPTPTPTPPPATGCTVTVPAGGSVQSALNGAANGATVCLTAGASYSASSEVLLSNRTDVTLDGNGATLHSVGFHPAIRLACDTRVTVRELTIVGSHPQPGTYLAGQEDAHGVQVGGGTGIVLSDLDIQNMQGDGFYIANCGTSWADGVTISDSRVADNGRMGIAVVAGRNVTASRMRYHDIAFSILDVEPDWNSSYRQGGTDLHFLGGTSDGWVGHFSDGSYGTAAFYLGTPYGAVGGAYAPTIARVTISGYTTTAARYGIWSHVNPSGGYRITDITFTDNTGNGSFWGPDGSVIDLNSTDRVTITGNTQTATSGHNMYFAVGRSSTSLSVSGNTIPGGVGQLRTE